MLLGHWIEAKSVLGASRALEELVKIMPTTAHLVKNDPRDVTKITGLSQKTSYKMDQNLWWAASYNILAIPLAAGALYNKGILVGPAIGALLMFLGTVIVAINSQTPRKHEATIPEFVEKKHATTDPVCGMKAEP